VSNAVTNGILVTVRSQYIPERSSISGKQYAFAYTVKIANQGPVTTRLESRHWIITDSVGHVEEVRGPGVVGVQPRLRPGEAFEYTSWCVIATPSGEMRGSYQMVTDAGGTFDADIAPFHLGMPQSLN
jgi:ApaG protein